MSNKLALRDTPSKRRQKGKSKTGSKRAAKNRQSAVLTILGLALAAWVAYLQLRPQIQVLPKEQLEKSEPFSAPFQIHNGGYLSLTLRRAICFVHSIKAGGITVTDSGMDIGNTIKDVTVEHGQNETVYCHFVGGAIPNEADIVIVVDYTPPGFPASYTSREYFHFTGANGDRWDWNERSTPDDLRRTADTHIKKWTRS